MASGHQQISHCKRSVFHAQKFQWLVNAYRKSSDQLREVDGYIFCPKDEYKVGRPTPDGTCVYIGLRVSDGKEVAVKCMLTDNCEHLAENETHIYNMMKMEKSPHVVRYRHFKKQDIFTYIVLELCEFSLKEYVEKARVDNHIPFDPQKIIKEMLTGLDVLHKRGDGEQELILHRDLKPDNVLVDVAYNIRLADFGVSKKVVEGQSTTYTSGKGNVEWQATESIPINSENVVYRRKSDVQVVGMLAFYVLTKGKHPFGDVCYEIPNNIHHGNPVNLNMLNDPAEKDFISWLLQKNIDDRPFADEALTHPYLKSLKDQFALLVAVGNQPEVLKTNPCYVVDQLNLYSNDYPNGWQQKIHPQIMSEFTANHYYNNAITQLLRFLRNVKEHINDTRTSESMRQLIGEPSVYFLHEDRFPILPMRVYRILKNEAKLVAPTEAWINRPTLKDFF